MVPLSPLLKGVLLVDVLVVAVLLPVLNARALGLGDVSRLFSEYSFAHSVVDLSILSLLRVGLYLLILRHPSAVVSRQASVLKIRKVARDAQCDL